MRALPTGLLEDVVKRPPAGNRGIAPPLTRNIGQQAGCVSVVRFVLAEAQLAVSVETRQLAIPIPLGCSQDGRAPIAVTQRVQKVSKSW
jgi:hypothetical protein